MKLIPTLIYAGGLWAGGVLAQSPVTLTIDGQVSGTAIPANFVGLSFGTKTLPGNKAGAHFFSVSHAPLITLFQNLGLTHLRVGGTTVESPPTARIPGETDIDNLFAFARVAGVKKIIYSLRLLETNAACQYAATNAAIAQYIWSHYRPELDCFAIGNEPDRQNIFNQDVTISNFPTYLEKWQKFAAAITNAVPEAKFAGPDGGSGNISWTTQFAEAEKDSGMIAVIAEHYYAGGKGKGVDARQGIEDMLSPDWVKGNQKLYKKMAVPVLADGLPFRFTEANDHYSGGISDASDTFAGALWALDFLHWWAAHDASGVDFHNTQWVASDVITTNSDGGLRINPKGYGIKAFDLGSHGSPVAVEISNPTKMNLMAYAVRGAGNLFVTIINKDHGPGARAADVTIVSQGIGARCDVIFLTAPGGDVTAKTGVTLGGASISSDGPWLGKWTALVSDKTGHCAVKVTAASAAVVKIATQ